MWDRSRVWQRRTVDVSVIFSFNWFHFWFQLAWRSVKILVIIFFLVSFNSWNIFQGDRQVENEKDQYSLRYLAKSVTLVVVDDRNEENKVGLGFMELTIDDYTWDFVDGVFDPCLFLLLL